MRLAWCLLPLMAAGCDDTEFPAHSTAVSGEGWTAVQGVFEGNCMSCHSASVALGDLDLETDACASLVGVEAAHEDYGGALLVAAGDAESSVLWHKCEDSGEYGEVMPQNGKMDQANVDVIRDWINDGAECSGGGDGGDGGGSVDATFANVQSEVFASSCNFCHTAGSGTGDDLVLDDGDVYAALVNAESAYWPGTLVVPGDPAASLLFTKMSGTQDADQGEGMPQGGTASAAQVGLVYEWIKEGANP